MRKKLAKIGNSWGVILSKEILDLLEIDDEVEFEVVGSTVMITAPDADATELESVLAYVASKRERSSVYTRLAQ